MTDSRRPSTDSSTSLLRSRTWSDDVQKHWSMPVLPAETFEQRLTRYTEYFKLKDDQILHTYTTILKELGRALGQKNNMGVRMLDTCISKRPSGNEKGIAYALDFSGTNVRAVRVRLEANGRISTIEHRRNIRDEPSDYPQGLLDKNCGAMQLFDYLATCVRELMEKVGDFGKNKATVPVGFSISFPCEQRGIESASLITWTKGFETGRETADPVEGLDVGILLDMAFWRQEINAKTVTVVNNAAATLIACEYEKPKRLPPCTVAFLCGVGVNGVFVESNAINFGYKGTVINSEIGAFDQSLPVTDVDLEVDFADQGGHGQQMLEKMVGGGYLGEICRRLVVKVYQSAAPPLAWARQSMPTAAAALCVADATEDLSGVDRFLRGLWEWETPFSTREVVKQLFTLVFDRSAALAAAAIAALAKKSGRLQPAMGGVTVAVDATFHATHPWYSDSVRTHLKMLLGDTAQFIHLYIIHDGAGKGAGVMAVMANEQ